MPSQLVSPFVIPAFPADKRLCPDKTLRAYISIGQSLLEKQAMELSLHVLCPAT